ncbi:uncharacterized protein LOC144422059 [Styela clava]
MKSAIILLLVATFVINSDGQFKISKAWKGVIRPIKILRGKNAKLLFKHRAKAAVLADMRALRELDEAEMNQMIEAVKMIRDMDEDEFNHFRDAQSVEDFE